MRILRIPAAELSSDLTEAWQHLHRTHDELASPYFSPHFTRLVGEVRDDVFIGVIEEGSRPVGFFPFHLAAMGRGRPIGLGLSDHHGVVIAPGVDFSVAELLRGCKLSCFQFDHLVGTQAQFDPFVLERDVSPIMDVSGGFEAYASAVRQGGSKQILKTGTLRRKLEREVGALRFRPSSEDAGVLADVIRWRSAKYDKSRVMFGNSWILELLRRILNARLDGFAGVLSGLWVGERLVAAHMGMRSDRVWHYWFPSYEEELSAYSPGVILLLEMAGVAPSLGVKWIDLGKGMSMYKERLMTGSFPVVEGLVELPSLATSMRRARRGIERWVRESPFATIARIPGRLLRRGAERGRFE